MPETAYYLDIYRETEMAKKRKNPRTKNGKARRSQNAARPGANDQRRRRKPTSVPEDASTTRKAGNRNGSRSDSSTTDDGRARLLARVLSLDEGTPEREESMGELSRHLRRHQKLRFTR